MGNSFREEDFAPMNYECQHRIETLLENAVMKEGAAPSFLFQNIHFSPWVFDPIKGWSENSWLAQGKIEAFNYKEAFNIFRRELTRIVPRLALIGQCYIDFVSQPFLILKEKVDIAFLSYVRDSEAVGLGFVDEGEKALTLLMKNTQIPEEFYFYWNDAVNSSGYSSKLLLMCSAIEALVKNSPRTKDWNKLETILGKDLKEEIWGIEGKSQKALRHRLVHGEYFKLSDSGKNYVDIVHKKIINYFNDSIFGDELISADVVNPQRHFWGNKEHWNGFIRAKGGNRLTLKGVLADLQTNGIDNPGIYEIVDDDFVTNTF